MTKGHNVALAPPLRPFEATGDCPRESASPHGETGWPGDVMCEPRSTTGTLAAILPVMYSNGPHDAAYESCLVSTRSPIVMRGPAGRDVSRALHTGSSLDAAERASSHACPMTRGICGAPIARLTARGTVVKPRTRPASAGRRRCGELRYRLHYGMLRSVKRCQPERDTGRWPLPLARSGAYLAAVRDRRRQGEWV